MSSHFYAMPVSDRTYPVNKLRPDPAKIGTTFNAGYLVPLWIKECVPGDNRLVIPAFSLRSQTPIHPVFDDAYFDQYIFFCPSRHQWTDFVKQWGEIDEDNYWFDTTEYETPQVVAPSVGFLPGSVADYLGLPVGSDSAYKSVSALPFRAYVHIWNTYFRDKNTMLGAVRPVDGNDVTAPSTLSGDDPWLTAYKGGGLLPVCRLPDYFSTCTPGPQRSINTVTLALDDVPVANGGSSPFLPEVWRDSATGMIADSDFLGKLVRIRGTYNAHSDLDSMQLGVSLNDTGSEPSSDQYDLYYKMIAKTSGLGISVNDLRFATQLQKALEKDLSVTTYAEQLKASFGIDINDGRMQRPELFLWKRYRLNQNQVVQSSSPTESSPMGSLAAYSLTVGMSRKAKIPAPEHGYLMCLGCIRVKHSYSQQLQRFWTRKDRFDYWQNLFRSLGNQAVMTSELYAGASATQIFGYQEYGADYRYNVSYYTGQMRPGVSGSLASWHYGDYYTSTPYLGSSWMQDNSKALIDRTLAVTSSSADQFFGVFQFGGILETEVSVYSVPGYMDHY